MTEEQIDKILLKFQERENLIPGSCSYQIGVVTNMRDMLYKWGKLTPRQIEFVVRLDQELESIESLTSWREEFLSDHKEKFDYIVQYYHQNNVPYYNDTVMKAVEEKNYIPSQRNYNKIVNNKYSTRVVDEMLVKAPKYEEGAIVMMRAGYPRRQTDRRAYHSSYHIDSRFGKYWMEPEQGWNYVVVKNDMMPRNACKGCRRYQLLPFGDTTIITTEQRWIKKARM